MKVTAAASSAIVSSTLMGIVRRALERILLAITILFAASASAWSAEGAGTIKTLTGSATISRETLVVPVSVGQRVFAGDKIASAPGSYVGIMLHDDTRLTVGPASEMLISEFRFNPSSHAGNIAVSFLKGTARVVTGLIGKQSPDDVRFYTPQGTIAIRGTEFVVDLEAD